MIPSDLLSRRPDFEKAPDPVDSIFPSLTTIKTVTIQPVQEDTIIKAQQKDNTAQKIMELLKTKHQALDKEWTMENNILCFRKRTFIPEGQQLRNSLVRQIHDAPSYGHPGIYRTQAILQRSFWWPQMNQFITKYIQGYALCQQMKVNTHPTAPPIQPIQPRPNTQPFQTVTMDFITALPTSNTFDSLMVIVDHDVTKAIVLIPCTKTIDALGTAKLYHNHVFQRFGLPKTIISDRGPQFASKVFQDLCSHLTIKSKMSTAFHPQTDGQTERANQDIEAYLRIYCSSHPHTWSDHIPTLEFAHNVNIQSATKQTPFKLLYGYHPIAIPDTINSHSQIPSVQGRLTELSLLRKEALAAQELARNRMIRHSSSKFTPFNPGQKVWLEATNLNTPNRATKLSPKREGPFIIKNKLSDLVYELELPKRWKIHPVFHAALLTPFRETAEHGPSFPQPPPDIIEGTEEYEIEAIIAHRGNHQRRQYLVKWAGYPDSENQWMPTRELTRNAIDILNRYKENNNL